MDKYGKLFVKASVIYLGLGALMGLHMAVFEHARLEIRYVHTHFMLIGFMANMIFGVSYHVLPRFNAKPVPHPAWVPLHFWLTNAGLWGLALFYALGGFWNAGATHVLFGISGLAQVVAMFLFALNMLPVLKDEPEPAQGSSSAPPAQPSATGAAPEVKIDPSMTFAEILDKWPHLEEMLTEEGLGALANPSVRKTAAKMVTLKMAAQKEKKDVFALIAKMEGKRLVSAGDEPATQPPAHPSGFMPSGTQITRGEMATGKTQIGNLLEVYPETRVVFETHYGAACFSCPGQKTETVEQTAMMHGMPAEKIVGEINDIIANALK